jgi:hypothetical protein
VRLATPVVVALLAVALVWILRSRHREATPRKFTSTDEFVQWLASEAVKDARENSHVSLDYSVDSIKQVEGILGKLHDQYSQNPGSISAKGLGSAYGAYIGEVIRRSEPGAKWEAADAVGGEKSYPLIWGAGHSYPMAWCYRRIVDGPEDNVWIKYLVLKNRQNQSLVSTTK